MAWSDAKTEINHSIRDEFFDAGTYTPLGGAAVPDIEAALDHGVTRVGFGSQVDVEHDELTFLKEDIPNPQRGDTYFDGTVTVELVSQITDDEQVAIWLVK